MPKGAQHILEVEGLSVSFGGAQVLRDVSVEVGEGQVVGVVGESGSGKTTLLRSIAQLLAPSAQRESGRVFVDGEPVGEPAGGRGGARADGPAGGRADARADRGAQAGKVAYLFQNGQDSLDPLFRIGRQFDEVLAANGQKPSLDQECALLARMDFDDPERILAALPSQLSGGECQRIALAFALATSPRLLLADEPTSSLDEQAQASVVGLIRHLNERDGLSVLLVSHDIDLVASLASEILIMRGGRVIERGATDQVMTCPREAYTREMIEAAARLRDGGRGRLCS